MTRLLTFLIATISWLLATGLYAAVEGDYYIETVLNDTENAHLVFMREEEKLARDTYITLNLTWGLRVFSNIASSEQTHMDAMLAKINLYGLADPVLSDAVGGTIQLHFDDCNSGTVNYDIPSINRTGTIPIQRVAADNVALCEALIEASN